MFDELQRIFRNSMGAFRAELHRREPEDQVVDLLSAMRKEWVAARAELPRLEETLTRTREELAREREQLAQCERRGAAARGIGDEETVRVAEQFAARHRERIAVLERKAEATEAERALLLRDVEQMKERYQHAEANRFSLLSEIRARQSRERRDQLAGDAVRSEDEFDRMAERVADEGALADAMAEVADPGPPPPPRPDPAAVEQRLQELKRRMGRE